MDRRRFIGTAGMAAVTIAHARASPLRLDLDTPRDNLLAWMKIRASLDTRDVYFWFTGQLEMAVPGEAIRPVVALESMILRRTERLGERLFHVTDWEATFYRDLATGRPLDGEIVNPVTGRDVRPLNYREGPVPFEYTDTRQPRVLGPDNPLKGGDRPFGYPWRVANGDLWMTKALYISGRPQWLDPAKFPEETPRTPLTVQTSSVMKARLADVLDPAQASVPAEFQYQATSDWLPWMLMGSRPGFVVWHEYGKKLFRLEDAPAETLAVLRREHPQWFRRPVPWDGFTNLFLRYRDERGPAAATPGG